MSHGRYGIKVSGAKGTGDKRCGGQVESAGISAAAPAADPDSGERCIILYAGICTGYVGSDNW